jgi:hypothetical protein
MELIDYLHIIAAVAFLIAAHDKLQGTQQEHFYTRILASAWFASTVLFQDMPVLLVRVISNCIVIALPMTEIVSPRLFKMWRNK